MRAGVAGEAGERGLGGAAAETVGVLGDDGDGGFEDVALGDSVEPGVTVVVQDAQAIGRTAAESAFSQLAGYTGPWRRIMLPTALVERGSGEMPPRT